MQTLLRLTYLAVIYGLLLTLARADERSSPYFQVVGNRDVAANESLPLPKGVSGAAISGGPAMVKNASVPEPGSIGLVALLVVLLALQRQRDTHA